MDVTEAVNKAKSWLAVTIGDEQLSNVGLEEVMFDETRNEWRITLGFSRPWDKSTGGIIGGPLQRSYKVIVVEDGTGKVVSMTNRLSQNNP